MKRIIVFIVVVFSVILPLRCFANIAEGISGSCKWVIDDNGVLTVSPSKGKKGYLEKIQLNKIKQHISTIIINQKKIFTYTHAKIKLNFNIVLNQ